VKGPLEFGNQVRRDPGLADQHDRVAIVAEAAEVLALRFGERHGGRVNTEQWIV
jgi:hypothetical protein